MAAAPLQAEAFLFAELTSILAGLSGVVTKTSSGIVPLGAPIPVYAGLQLPTQVTPYICYSRVRTNFAARPLGGGYIEQPVMLIEMMADLMLNQFDLAMNAIKTQLDGASDQYNVSAAEFEDFRWSTVEIKTPSEDKMVLQGQMYFNLWVR